MRLAALAFAALAFVGCAGSDGDNKVSARDTEVQTAVEDKIKQTVSLNALGMGSSAKFLVVQCIPESDTKLSCIVSASIGGQPVQVPWEGIVDPDTGRFNVYSVG